MPSTIPDDPAPAGPRLTRLLALLAHAVPLWTGTGASLAARTLPRILRDLPGAESLAQARGVASGPVLLVPELGAGAGVESEAELEREAGLESPAAAAVGAEQQIRFANDDAVPWPFRGRCINLRLAPGLLPLRLREHERVLASSAAGPLWVAGPPAGRCVFRSAFVLPRLGRVGSRPVDIDAAWLVTALPLLQLMRLVAGTAGYAHPPLRAAFIIDDPNLHWPRYGYADYQAIADDAQRHAYHVAFATIPLDAWFTHERSARIFRAHPQSLSLLIHGNNHRRDELAQAYSAPASSALLHQSVARIRSLEAKAMLPVCRVMVPPHGACSARVLAQLPTHGFEAACISAGSLRAHNPAQPWTHELGLKPSEWVEACPVLPRWAFAGFDEATLLCAAYLGQPLIVRGHHQDLSDGPELFASVARRINGLGPVRWGTLTALSRMNVQTAVSGRSMQVRPLGNRVEIVVPDGVAELLIEGAARDWRCPGVALAEPGAGGTGIVLPVRAGQVVTLMRDITIESPPPHTPRTAARLVLRRLMTEARDRLQAT